MTTARRWILLFTILGTFAFSPRGQVHVNKIALPRFSGVPEGNIKMVTPDVVLTCRANVSQGKLVMTYDVTNRARMDIYVLDAVPAVEQQTRTAYVDLNSVFISWRDPSTALLMRGITPLPADKTVVVRVIPLGTKLTPGQKIERTFDVPLPLKEQSIYYGSLKAEEMQETNVNKLLLVVQFIRSTVDGFKAEPAHYAPAYYVVRGRHTVGQAQNLECQSDIQQVKLLKRTDNFTRL